MAHILLTGATGFVGKQILKIPETQDLFAEKSDWWYDALDGIDTVIHSA